MFVELKKKVYEQLREYMIENQIQFEVSDCSLPGEKEQFVHIEFQGNLSEEMIAKINDKIATIYGSSLPGKEDVQKDDKGGIAEYEEERAMERSAVSKPKKRDVTYNPIENAKDYLTGKDEMEME